MFGVSEFDNLVAYYDIERDGYSLEADDLLAAWRYGEANDPAWYIELPDSIRREIEAVDQSATE